MDSELAPKLHEAVTGHCADGDALAEAGRHHDAIVVYNKAWALLPDPKNRWNAATWILAAIGDAAFAGGFRDLARKAFHDVMTCPAAIGNPFLHLRRGQVLFDDGSLDAAADELMRAFMGAGPEIFESEPPQYLTFLRTRAAID